MISHQKQERLTTWPKQRTTWAWALGTFFSAGLLRPGPGTYGSIAAVLLWFGTGHAFHPAPLAMAVGTGVAALAATLIGIPAATIVARESGREDPGHVVIDEVAGQLVALIAIPCDWRHAAVGLLLFRLFDIFKPPPIRQLERLPEGTGIMLDDVMAGVFALICGQILLRWL
ncbi:phosphatidylglycerophosphatase A [Granulicella rosea]|uniref:Phosphatidylglycerophosphatase A n=1 Tax=Granulicella rosea TaxID=474952 RepID=A0A239MAZ7_9BACT|nr:phosphatidylglycerophosphatase A [Granulicella rosea]SNT39811.1 phosphatidylglycerophosphatase A [Granulicella rosea]